MKTNILRETFDSLRNQRNRFGLRLRLTFFVTLELLICIAIALGVDALLKFVFQIVKIPLWVDLLVISVLVGFLLTGALSRVFFDPIKKLRKAIEQVADGDFDVRIETKSSSTEIKEIFSGFNLMAQELSSTEILQTDFVSNVSHEFKTPINAIEGYSMLLQSCDNLSCDERLYVEKIILNTRRLSSLVGSILLLSKLDNQSITPKPSLFSLDEQIRQAIVDLENEWNQKEIDFEVDLQTIPFYGQENLMYHVWSNLISNAIKFSPPRGCVTITMKAIDNKIVVTVADQGPGLSEEAQKHVFDKFYQGDTSHKENGNGLGLALVKKIVTLSQGTVTAENLSNTGAIFTVTLWTSKENFSNIQ